MKNKNLRAQEKQSEENSLKSTIHRAGYQSVGKDARRAQADRTPEGRGLGGRGAGMVGRAWLQSEFESQFLSLTRWPDANYFTADPQLFIFEAEIIGAP